jgi:nitrogen-specific signal transduction histidine kinase
MTVITPHCILLTEDPKFQQRIEGTLTSLVKIVHVTHERHLDRFISQSTPFLILLDTRIHQLDDFLDMIDESAAPHLIIGFGDLHSNRVLELESKGLYACESLECDISRCQQLIQRAFDHLKLQLENSILQESALLQSTSRNTASMSGPDAPLPLRHFYRAFRNFHNIDALLESIVEGFTSSAMLSRVGIFVRVSSSKVFRLRTGIRCLEVTEATEYPENDPFVRWLEIHACMISRANLDHIQTPSEKLLLKQALDSLGAEIIIPIHARSGMIGWMFMGPRATGIPFKYAELEEFIVVTEHIATSLENATLYEEVTSQKGLLEALIHTMPTGIIAIGSDAKICWFNRTAEDLFKISAEKVLNKPVEVLGSRIADLMRRTLAGERNPKGRQWTEPLSQKTILVHTHYLIGEKTDLGAVALVEDVTAQKLVKEQEKQLQRNKFWAELATHISHHIRNPLVAIRTFAQLLPERYDDPDFRQDFWRLVPQEIERLDKMIDQVDVFANPPERMFKPFELEDMLKKSIEIARFHILPRQIKIDLHIPDNLPEISGDETSLSESFSQLLSNAIEATAEHRNPEISVSAELASKDGDSITIKVQDNGKGIPSNIQGELFSPFCTTKTTGMGLGLPVAQRTILDHNGKIDVQSGIQGTCVTVSLPLNPNPETHESYSHH